MKMTCIIADDEPLAREGLRRLIHQHPFLELVAVSPDAAGVLTYLKDGEADLLFADIHMPDINGLELIRRLSRPIAVILTTAYAQYAMEGFELDVIDYLLKPITPARFEKAIQKAKALHGKPASFIFVKTSGKMERVLLEDIEAIEARLNYVLIHRPQGPLITYASIKSMVDLLPPKDFRRVHKSYIVARSKIKSMDGNQIQLRALIVPVSRTHKAGLQEWMASS
jgi:DNA-binding LytR/AlgR family response regulator